MTEDERKRKKRADVLRAARQVFSEKGYHQATVEEIADRAGMAKGTVYLYFSSKADILLECLREIFEGLSAKMKKVVEENEANLEPDPISIMRATVELYLTHLNQNKEIIRLALTQMPSLAKEMDDEHARQHIHKMPWIYVDHVADGLSRGMKAGFIRKTNPRILALGLLGAAQNITLYHLYNQPEKDLGELLDDIVEVVKNMIMVNPCETKEKHS